MKCIGIDIGGTFTDFIFVDMENNIVSLHKVSSTIKDQSIGVKKGLKLFEELEDISLIIHGTTVATNAILEGKGAKTALITTKGFEDILEIGRQNRINLYSFHPERIVPLVPSDCRYGITERVGSEGQIVAPLDLEELESIIQKIKDKNIESVAISLLFSFFNPKHEKLIYQDVKRNLPLVNVSKSSWVLPVFREFDRTSVTVLDAYVAPIMRKYFSSFLEVIHNFGITTPPLILLSTGGVTQIKNASEKSVETVLSGLTGGVLGGYYSAKLLAIDDVLTLDVGGTSTDVASIVNGQIEITTENRISGHPIPLPTIAVQTIGAGGGSIAKEEHGILCVGPTSAGAEPGPACYGKGGDKPTVTDANLVRGLLNPDYFCGGTIQINPEYSKAVISNLSKSMNFSSVEECAEGIIDVFENNIALALRKVSTERGLDSRTFALCCFGGAGPLHGCSLAKRLSMKKVIIPPFPGVWSALGLLTADIRHDYTKSVIKPLNDSVKPVLNEFFDELSQIGVEMCIEDGFKESEVEIIKNVDIRLIGQSYEITVPYHDEIQKISEAFDIAHKQAYGYSSPDSPREVVNIRVSAVVYLPKLNLISLPQGDITPPDNSYKGLRKIYIHHNWMEAKVYIRSSLLAGNIIKGPSVIEQEDSTILIDVGWNASVEPDGHLILTQIKEEG